MKRNSKEGNEAEQIKFGNTSIRNGTERNRMKQNESKSQNGTERKGD